MADLALTVQPRTVLGKKVAALRRQGLTPANVYGHNVASTAIQADAHDLNLLVRRAGRTALIQLNVEGEREPRAVLVRDLQRRATTGVLLHVDFLQVSMRERLTVTVPIQMTGTAPVLETTDAVVFQNLDTLQVECLPGDIPQHIDADVSGLTDASISLHVRDLVVPAKVTVLNDPDVVVVSVTLRTAQAEVEAEEAAAAEEAPAAEEVPTVGASEPEEEADAE
jgi:large subunit ribosomal protein L25